MEGGTISGNTASNGGGVYGGLTMQGGSISKNTAGESSGGVYVSGTLTKTNGVITGYTSDTVNGNRVANDDGSIKNYWGHAVYFGTKRLEKTVSASHNLDTRVDGADGGWVDE
jgi:hypothetical protein